MNYSNIAIALGKKCTAECDICCLDCSIHNNEIIDLDSIKKIISTTYKADYIKSINFTGGEAFLYYDYLLELIPLSKKNNKYVSVITNGFWATDIEVTYNKLCELKKIGLDLLTVSYDAFHAHYIPINNIKNIIYITKKLNIKLLMQSVIINNDNINWINELGNNLADVNINFVAGEKVGRAKYKIQDSSFIRETDSNNCVCRKAGAFMILWDGSVWPCCSPSVYSTSLSIGSIHSDLVSIEDIINRFDKDVFLKVLRNKGFNFYKNMMIDNNIVEVPDLITSSCELCRLFFTHENKEKIYLSMVKEKIYKI